MRRFRAPVVSLDLLPLEFVRPPADIAELAPLVHAHEPDPEAFVDELVITLPLTPDCSLR